MSLVTPTKTRVFPYRKVLPVLQLAICLIVIWFVREQVLLDISPAVLSHARAARKTDQQVVVNLPPLTKQQEGELAAKQRRDDYYMNVPVVLDFPNIILQLPYALAMHREWTPAGLVVETWRVVGWPFIGLVFWWVAGRGFEALQAARHGVISPRVHWIEAVSAVILTLSGGLSLIGLVTTTPDDRADLHFMALLAGALLWGALSFVMLVARFRQWRIRRRAAIPSVG